jgi:hypothetical protein
MAIKRNITDITNLRRGSNQVTAVYRGTTLIWPTTPPSDNNTWLTNGLNLILNETVANQDVYVTRGLNIKLR